MPVDQWRLVLALGVIASAAGEVPVPAALAVDDECGMEEREGECGLALRQLRGQALSGGQSDSERRALEREALAVADNATISQRQIPPWLWKILHPPGAPSYSPPGYTPSYGQATQLTVYMYRAKSAENYDDTNVNMANLAGVMWYLHNEVVRSCPVKFGVTRVVRYKVTMKAPPHLYTAMHHGDFAHLCHFDSGRCTGPQNSIKDYSRYGYAVGCDRPSFHAAAYKQATWFSMPGKCPTLTWREKSKDYSCGVREPGGECHAGQTWSKTCTWWKEYAGEVSLEELTGVKADHAWCRHGNYLWKDGCDCGRGTSFWNGKHSSSACSQREEKLRSLFQRKYPNQPADLGTAHCPFGDHLR